MVFSMEVLRSVLRRVMACPGAICPLMESGRTPMPLVSRNLPAANGLQSAWNWLADLVPAISEPQSDFTLPEIALEPYPT
jgi:hypothetical protein